MECRRSKGEGGCQTCAIKEMDEGKYLESDTLPMGRVHGLHYGHS